MKTMMSNNNSVKRARCPVTGQMGVCPSQQFGSSHDDSSSAISKIASCGLSPQEQQANLWQSLLERNGHVPPTKLVKTTKAPPTLEDAAEDASTSSSSLVDCPELMPASQSFSASSSDCDSLTSGSSSQPTAGQGQERVWPTYDQVSAHVLVADYRDSLTDGTDQHSVAAKTEKLLCPHGVVCQAKMEFFQAPHGHTNKYTGLLSPGSTAEHCLLRLSSALRPVDNGGGAWAKAVARRTFGPKLASSQILPAAAIKCFRDGQSQVPSGNILLMGSKVGQPQRNFFEHSLCTAVTEKIPTLGLPFLRRFSRYSKYPLSLGLSEVCRYDVEGKEEEQPNFPFALCLYPVVKMKENPDDDNDEDDDDETRPFDAFIEDIPRQIEPGTHLFDIYAAPTPESIGCSNQLQRIGRVVSTSNFIYSSPTDGLTFRHQVKEDDLQLKPDWEDRMHNTPIVAPDGTKGTSAKLTGWQIFEDHIDQKGQGNYVDFEKEQQQQRKGGETNLARKKSVSFAGTSSFDSSAINVKGWTFCGFKKAHVKVPC